MSLNPASAPSGPRRKAEDTVEGCRLLASADRTRAGETESVQIRMRLLRSADAWHARAALLERKRVPFNPEAPQRAIRTGENENG